MDIDDAASTAAGDSQESTSSGGTTGWSKAARRRRARRVASGHPLGTRIGGGPGYSEYRDDTFSGSTVQIWDRS